MMITQIHRDPEIVVKDLIIDRKQIVAIYQNESEWGPRALGNRSILLTQGYSMQKILLTKSRRENTIDLLPALY